MAVRLDIRPRLVLRDEPVAKVRRGLRLPPLTVPAVGYWLAMGALTYFFANLGESPLDAAFASAPPEPTPALAPAPEPEPAPLPAAEPAAVPAPIPKRAPEPTLAQDPPTVPEDPPALSAEAAPAVAREHPRDGEREREREPQVASLPLPAPELPRAALRFPEFTDTSPTPARERASAGPRIDSDLFGEAPEQREPTPDAPRAPESDASRPAVALSCEAAIARNREEITIGGRRGPADVTRDAYAAILENGRYLGGCAVPDRTVFEVCAAVQNGRAVGITVASNPPSAALNACVRRAVSRLKFPTSPRLDVTRTRFDAVRR